MERARKEEVVELLRSDLSTARSVVLTSFVKLDVNTVNEFRAECRKQGVTYRLVKNTLAKRAIEGTEMEVMSSHFSGPTAIAYSAEDAVAPAKVVKEFAKKFEKKYEVRAGYLDGQILDQAGVEQLASMPSREELQAKLLSVFNGVATKMVRLLNAAPQQFVQVLNARRQDLES